MFNRFICCFKSNNTNNVPSPSSYNLHVKEKGFKNDEEISVRITSDVLSQNSNTIIDITNQYNSINNIDKTINWKDTVQFIPPVEKGIVIKVYDGDTITIASKLPYPESLLYRFSVRLNGIDCPEIKGNDENEKQCAQIAKQEMSNLIMNKIVTLKNVQTEKYGRILADVYIDDLHLNNYMLEKRLAVTYDGGTKKCPNNWMNYYITGEF
jgi:endonuclease YncB( thermonuclease family)